MTHYQTLCDALLTLAGLDPDQARQHNEVGYNGRDSAFGHDLAEHVRAGRQLTANQQQAAIKMLQTYRHTQLAHLGLPTPAEYQLEGVQQPDVLLDAGANTIAVGFPNPQTRPPLVEKIKNLPGRRWNPETKVWTLPASQKDAVVDLFPDAQRTVAFVMLQPTNPKPVTAPAEPAKRIENENGKLIIRFPYDPALVARVKSLPERRWDPSAKEWSCPSRLAAEVVKLLPDFAVDAGTQALIDQQSALAQMANKAESEFTVPTMPHLYPFQRAGVEFLEKAQGRAILADEMGLGKRLALGTLVLTPDGWIPIEKLQIGEPVIGRNGHPYPITAVYRCENRPLYRIAFSDGVTIDADDEHLWTVQHVRNDTPGRYPDTNGRWRTLTTAEILAIGLTDNTGNRNWRIPLVSPVQHPHRDLPAEPYLVGVCLGDGSYNHGERWTLCTDHEILETVQAHQRRPHKTSVYTGYGTVTVKELPGKRAWNKRVPTAYLFASEKQRRALLSGILDTDGHINPSGTVQHSTTSAGLAADVVALVQSLGGTATTHTKPTPHYTYQKVRRTGRPAYVTTIRLAFNPFLLRRKAQQWQPLHKYPPTRTIANIERIANGPGVCIAVDSPDHTFVVHHYIVTHNTHQAMAYLELHPELRPAIIVVPASLKLNWNREIDRWMTQAKHVHIINGTKPYSLPTADLYIVNYDLLIAWLDTLLALKTPLLIADEVHMCKNTKTQRTKSLQKLAREIPRVIGLTGTPVTNRPAELWPLLNMVDRAAWPNFFPFAKRYCNAYHDGWSWHFDGASHLDELHAHIKPYVVRRTKAQVLTELPAKQRTPLVVELDFASRRAYQAAIGTARSHIAEARQNHVALGANHLALIEYAKQAAVAGKLPHAFNWIQDFLATDKKLVVFATHHSTVDSVIEHFGAQAVKLTGHENVQQRQSAVDRFQSDDTVRLFVGNIRAAGVGITLTAASNVLFLELDWTPGAHSQAEDRTHRIGQTDSVTSFYMLAANTIDEDIYTLLEAKRQIVDTVSDGTPGTLEFSLLGELARAITKGDDE